MARKAWNEFLKAHSAYKTLVAVTPKIPPGPHFDKNNKKLPTFCEAFKKWARSNLSDDWTTLCKSQIVTVLISSKVDIDSIHSQFGIKNQPQKTRLSDKTYSFNYDEKIYVSLVSQQGFSLKK